MIYVDPTRAAQWSAEEVAERWVRLCPARANGDVDSHACRVKQMLIATDPIRVALYRKRLAELPWFMRSLNEPIARSANREDACTGRFWEGRYRCQALLDDAAVLACMTYVDLNPIRAGVATDLPNSAHTSIRLRLSRTADATAMLQPVAGSAHAAFFLDHAQYVELVDWTGRRQHSIKRGRISADQPATLALLRVGAGDWIQQVATIETRYWRAIGSVAALIEKARALGQCWLKGSGSHRRPQQMAIA